MNRVPFLQASDSAYTTLPELYEKYGLSIGWLWMHYMSLEEARLVGELPTLKEWECQVNHAIRNHWLVCRYLEEHPETAVRFLKREQGWWYFDILDVAEQKYLGLLPYKERE